MNKNELLAHTYEYCTLESIPEEVNLKIAPTMKIEKIVSTLHTYLKVGVQVVHLSGSLCKLEECREFIGKLSKSISIFVDNPENCPKSLKKYMENC